MSDLLSTPRSSASVGRSVFERLRRRVRSGILVEGLAWVAVAVVGFVAVSYAVDRAFRLETGYRAGLLIALLATIAWLVYRGIVRPVELPIGGRGVGAGRRTRRSRGAPGPDQRGAVRTDTDGRFRRPGP